MSKLGALKKDFTPCRRALALLSLLIALAAPVDVAFEPSWSFPTATQAAQELANLNFGAFRDDSLKLYMQRFRERRRVSGLARVWSIEESGMNYEAASYRAATSRILRIILDTSMSR